MLDANEAALAEMIEQAAADAGADVYAHAIDIDGEGDIGLRADDPVVTASVFKIPVLTEYVRQAAAGELNPASRLEIPGGTGTMGPTGLSVFTDDAVWSLRDVATSMVTVSDNAATDIVLHMVGVERVNATMAALGLPATVLVGGCAEIFASIATDYCIDDTARIDEAMRSEPERVPGLTACRPESTNRSTPRESTSLLRLLWTDGAANPEACAEARRIMGLQVWPHRLSSGFSDDVRVSGKTGTIGVIRNEIGVVEFPDGHRYAVAVFLRTHRFGYRQPAADALIGTVARMLVDHLADAP